MGNLYYLIIILLVLNFIFLKNYRIISKKYNLFDIPNEKRKKQIEPVPLLGGLLYLINILIFFSYEYFFNNKSFFNSLGFYHEMQILFFIFILLLIFLVGYIDDKINIKPFNRLIILSLLILILLELNSKTHILNLNFSFYEKEIDLFNLSMIFTICCIITYMIILNMLDGINLISGIYYLSIIFIFFTFNFQITFSLTFLIFLIFFICLNYDGRIYLGDGGVYLISIIISLLLINLYKIRNITVEQIFLFMFLPAVDFFRLVVLRILNKQSPLVGDENHFHHIISRRYNKFKMIIFIIFIFLPVILSLIFKLNELLVIFMMLVLYIIFLTRFLEKNK